MAGRPLPRSWYDRPSVEVAPELLNKLLVVRAGTGRAGGRGEGRASGRVDVRADVRAGRIVEVEAYAGADDPASHAYRGETARNTVMFGPPGHLYVYFTYGMHWCANVTCAAAGTAQAVLLRALAPVAGIEAMQAARGERVPARDLCRGPARLTKALGINRADDGTDVVGPGRITVVDDGVAPPIEPGQGGRVGLSVAGEVPWRWWVAGDTHVSAFRSGGKR